MFSRKITNECYPCPVNKAPQALKQVNLFRYPQAYWQRGEMFGFSGAVTLSGRQPLQTTSPLKITTPQIRVFWLISMMRFGHSGFNALRY